MSDGKHRPGTMTDTPTTSITKIVDTVKHWAERSPAHPALVEASGSWTYQQLNEVIAETQKWLAEAGVRPGDRVLIVCENCRTFVALLLALVEIDAWPVLVSAQLAAREVDEIRDHCGAPTSALHDERVSARH